MKHSFLKGLAIVLLLASVTLLISSPSMLAEWQPLPIDLTPGPVPRGEFYGPDGLSYKDDSIEVSGRYSRAYDTNYVVMHVKIVDPSQLRTAAAGKFNGENTALGRTIASRNNAVIALNGDYFVMNSFAVAIRQGKLFRNKPNGQDVLLIDAKGDFHVMKAPTKSQQVDETLAQLEAEGRPVVNAFMFGPLLVENGVSVIPEKENYRYFNVGAHKHAQRISFSQIGELEYLILATEGPDNQGSRGMTVYEMSKTTEEEGKNYAENGCIFSYNLDGGSSSTIAFNNKKINAPGSKSRSINDIIYFATLVR